MNESDQPLPEATAPPADPASPGEPDESKAAETTASPAPGFIGPGPTWQEQDAQLRDMWLQNKTPQDIADVLGRSPAAIMTRAARLGLPRRAAPGRKPGGSRRMLGTEDGAVARAVPRSAPRNYSRPVDENAPQPSPRICLMCLRQFASLGRHNRICPSCKNSSEYESAVSIPDYNIPL